MSLLLIIWTGYFLDLLLGDPEYRFHPVRLIGQGIISLERKIRSWCQTQKSLYIGGVLLAISVVTISWLIVFLMIHLVMRISPLLATGIQIGLVYSLLATRGLFDAARKVVSALVTGNIDAARFALAEIVGRDTAQLNQEEIIKAVVETVSENSVDGIIAPLFYLFIGGVPLMVAYKAINTLDSMVGYQNEQYRALGWFSARLDDWANYIPARISLGLITGAAVLLKLDYKNAWRIGWRDRYQHKSPNSAWSEAATAGALGIELGGSHFYSGILVEKPTIGFARCPVVLNHVNTTLRLVFVATSGALILFSVIFICAGGI